MAGQATRIEVTLLADGGVEVIDDGRGIPVEQMSKTKRSALTTVLTTLHAGGKFEQGPTPSPAGCTVSGSRWSMRSPPGSRPRSGAGPRLLPGVHDGQPKTKDPKKVKPIKKTGTTIRFWPSPLTFQETTEFDYDTVASRLRDGIPQSGSPDHTHRSAQ